MKEREINEIFVISDTYNFWWALKGIEPSYDEDLFIGYGDPETDYKKTKVHSVEIATRGYLIKTDTNRDYDEDEVDYLCELADKTLGEMFDIDKPFYIFGYPEYEVEKEVDFEAPRNKEGQKPSRIIVFHPAESITREVVSECLHMFCKDFLDYEGKILLEHEPEDVLEFHKKVLKQREDWKETIRTKGPCKSIFTYEFLTEMFEEEELPPKEEIEYGTMEEDGWYVRLKNGKKIRIADPDGNDPELKDSEHLDELRGR